MNQNIVGPIIISKSNKVKKRDHEIFFVLKTKTWKDPQTSCWIIYCKQYEISAYGKTYNQAKKMFIAQVKDILTLKK